MIKKIDIGQFGQFKQYQWNTMIGTDLNFKKMNIIYGRNYSGKTTLSRIFRCIEKDQIHRNYCGSEFEIHLEDGTVINHNDIGASNTRLNFRVYNSDFVGEHLSWLHNSDGTIVPFTVLGQQNVEIENKVKEIDNKLGSIESSNGFLFELDQLKTQALEKRNEYQKKHNGFEKQLSDKARDIKNNSLVFNRSVYHSTHIKSDIGRVNESFILDDQQKVELITLLKEESKPEIKKLSEAKPNFASFYSRTKELIEKRITPSQPITELVEDALLQEWVRSGIDKHRDKRESCGFCGNQLPKDIWEKLDAHFDKESENLRSQIEKLIGDLETAAQVLSRFLTLKRDQFYFDLRTRFDELYSSWEQKSATYKANIGELIEELGRRRDDIFNSITMKEIEDVSDQIADLLTSFNQLSDENNERTNTLSKDQDKAREELRLSEVAEFKRIINYSVQVEEIQQLETAAQDKEEERDRKQLEIDELEEQKRSLLAEAQDESRGAELVNRYLEHFFGHQELKLVADGEKTSMCFKIMRDREDAQNLSEGECSLISFCYFIAKLENELHEDPDNLYIYIDDPISSLDSNHVFFIFSLIENIIAKEKKYTQLFISTHSLDFLKYVKRLTMPKRDGSKTAYFIMQKRGKNQTSLVKAPAYLKDYITEFNYLFSEIYFCAMESEQALAERHHYSFGNNMRKFLESYLFFKYPNHMLKPEQRVDKFFGGDTVSASLVNRVINEYSHLAEQFDRGITPVDVDEIKKIARIVLKQIHGKDPDQYNELCKSVELNPVHSWLANTGLQTSQN